MKMRDCMRFIHTSDWQLGKPFGRLPPQVRTLLQEARLDAIDTLAAAARAAEAQHVLVAGDVFDCAEPGDRVWRTACNKMSASPGLRWWLLPGNHDPARSDGLWSRLARDPPANVTALLTPEPAEAQPGVWILPAPLTHRMSSADATAWFDAAETPPGAVRVGLAHGSVQGFGSDTPNNPVAPDRARRAGLDYLALGDWHGQICLNERTWYAGTPEPDRFKVDDMGRALVVTAGTGESPCVDVIGTGRYVWLRAELRLDSLADLDRFRTELEAKYALDRLLLDLLVTGALSLSDRVEVGARLQDQLAHDVRWLDLDLSGLGARPTEADLAAIDVAGVLRDTADRLHSEAQQETEQGRLAAAALERLLVTHRSVAT